MQNKHMEQSISLASEIQKAFKGAKRSDRGVKQAGLLVLRKTSMPAVLIELGFLTNQAEERFMKSTEGQNKLAKAVYDAFAGYKHEFDKRQNTAVAVAGKTESQKVASTTTALANPTASTSSSKTQPKSSIVYKVQILASPKNIPTNSRQFKGYKNIASYRENGLYKYTYGESSDLAAIKVTYKKLQKDFKDAFIVAFKDGKRIKQNSTK
jgi:N-acetylmuramoyl-L-alanine amidase